MSGTQAAQHAYNERSHYGHITVTLFQTHISMPRGETTSDHQSDQQAHQYAHGEHLCMQYDRLTAILRWRRRYLSVTCAVGNLYFGSSSLGIGKDTDNPVDNFCCLQSTRAFQLGLILRLSANCIFFCFVLSVG